jgi:DNA replication protein DnaC
MTPWCGACWEKRRAAEDAAAEQAWRAEIKQLGRIAGAPAFPFADLQKAEFLRQITGKKLLQVGQRYALERSLVFTGPSGVGKSTVARAMLRRLLRQEVEKVLGGPVGGQPTPMLKRLSRALWTDGFALAQARRQAPMGRGEAELVEQAFRTPVLILDEVGQEPICEVIFEVADRRYRDGSLTILTTGLTSKKFAGRYGDACWRRFAERAAVISEWTAQQEQEPG